MTTNGQLGRKFFLFFLFLFECTLFDVRLQNVIRQLIQVRRAFLRAALAAVDLLGGHIVVGPVTAAVAVVSVETPSLAKVLSGCVFPGGLAMVILAGSELFTGNCLLIIPCLSKEIKVREMVRNLVIVYLGNLLGGLLVCALLVYGHTFSMGWLNMQLLLQQPRLL